MDWMDHVNYLQVVVNEDVRCIMEKEQTYQGSWKRSGGRSAWFMLRRKIDRMLEMLKKPEEPKGFNLRNVQDTIKSVAKGSSLPGSPEATRAILDHLLAVYNSEDIFLKIQEDPTGQDGCVLAEIRDLRRYLTLVEAEMISRGVVEYPNKAVPKARIIPTYSPGTPEDGGHHAAQSDAEIEEQILAARKAQQVTKEKIT